MDMLTFLMAASSDLPTKQRFGEIMHDPDMDEEEKQRILDKVMQEGGYDNLDD